MCGWVGTARWISGRGSSRTSGGRPGRRDAGLGCRLGTSAGPPALGGWLSPPALDARSPDVACAISCLRVIVFSHTSPGCMREQNRTSRRGLVPRGSGGIGVWLFPTAEERPGAAGPAGARTAPPWRHPRSAWASRSCSSSRWACCQVRMRFVPGPGAGQDLSPQGTHLLPVSLSLSYLQDYT
jgi:hypothetical protein